MSEPLLTARAVADLFDVSPETVLRWTRRGELPAIRLPGGAIRYREGDLDAWLVERATPGRGSVSHPAGTPPRCRLAVSATPDEEN
jgi:excisionase family DNA binding protein